MWYESGRRAECYFLFAGVASSSPDVAIQDSIFACLCACYEVQYRLTLMARVHAVEVDLVQFQGGEILGGMPAALGLVKNNRT